MACFRGQIVVAIEPDPLTIRPDSAGIQKCGCNLSLCDNAEGAPRSG